MSFNNPKYKKGVEQAKEALEAGRPLSEAYNDNLPVEFRLAFTVGSTTGKLGDMLRDIARIKVEDIAVETEEASQAISSISLLVIGLVVGLVVGALYVSMISFSGALTGGGGAQP
jgi:type II secretory pathway component PulF